MHYEIFRLKEIILNTWSVDRGLSGEICLLGCLVKSPDDARLLMSEEIILSAWSPDEVFGLLNRMMERISLGPVDSVYSFNIESTLIVIRRHMKMRKRMTNEFENYALMDFSSPFAILCASSYVVN